MLNQKTSCRFEAPPNIDQRLRYAAHRLHRQRIKLDRLDLVTLALDCDESIGRLAQPLLDGLEERLEALCGRARRAFLQAGQAPVEGVAKARRSGLEAL
ncbi:hypothetical protein D3C72_1620990 [compost metagenome]